MSIFSDYDPRASTVYAGPPAPDLPDPSSGGGVGVKAKSKYAGLTVDQLLAALNAGRISVPDFQAELQSRTDADGARSYSDEAINELIASSNKAAGPPAPKTTLPTGATLSEAETAYKGDRAGFQQWVAGQDWDNVKKQAALTDFDTAAAAEAKKTGSQSLQDVEQGLIAQQQTKRLTTQAQQDLALNAERNYLLGGAGQTPTSASSGGFSSAPPPSAAAPTASGNAGGAASQAASSPSNFIMPSQPSAAGWPGQSNAPANAPFGLPTNLGPQQPMGGGSFQALDTSGAGGGGKGASAPTQQAGPPQTGNAAHDAFIAQMWPTALAYSQQTGIPPQVFVAINASETNWGNAGSLFGIKGPGQDYATHEVVNGQSVPVTDSFKTYATPDAGYQDFINLISQGRYAPAWQQYQQDGNWQGLLQNINKAGYATDPGWASMIGSLANQIGGPSGNAPASTPLSGFADVAKNALAQAQQAANPQRSLPAGWQQFGDQLIQPNQTIKTGQTDANGNPVDYTGTNLLRYDAGSGNVIPSTYGVSNPIVGGTQDPFIRDPQTGQLQLDANGQPQMAWWASSQTSSGRPIDASTIEQVRRMAQPDRAEWIRQNMGREPTWDELNSGPGGQFPTGDPMANENRAAINATGKSLRGLGYSSAVDVNNPLSYVSGQPQAVSLLKGGIPGGGDIQEMSPLEEAWYLATGATPGGKTKAAASTVPKVDTTKASAALPDVTAGSAATATTNGGAIPGQGADWGTDVSGQQTYGGRTLGEYQNQQLYGSDSILNAQGQPNMAKLPDNIRNFYASRNADVNYPWPRSAGPTIFDAGGGVDMTGIQPFTLAPAGASSLLTPRETLTAYGASTPETANYTYAPAGMNGSYSTYSTSPFQRDTMGNQQRGDAPPGMHWDDQLQQWVPNNGWLQPFKSPWNLSPEELQSRMMGNMPNYEGTGRSLNKPNGTYFAGGGIDLAGLLGQSGTVTNGPEANVDLQTGAIKSIDGEAGPEAKVVVPLSRPATDPLAAMVQRIMLGGTSSPVMPNSSAQLGMAAQAIRPRVKIPLGG